ncbi:MAG: hypothetical protein DRN81_05770 [Thermoproteota archaeon]|nr:MAG: hypothetical protein DRN81_05770 [Candidatus Korarchaeota archaeon]
MSYEQLSRLVYGGGRGGKVEHNSGKARTDDSAGYGGKGQDDYEPQSGGSNSKDNDDIPF